MDLRPALSRFGQGATLFFALFAGFSTAGLYLGLAGMIGAACLTAGFWRWAGRHALFWMALAYCAYILLRSALAAQYAVAANEFEDARNGMIALTGIYGFVLGWWLIDRAETRCRALVLLPLGLVLGLATTDPEQWQRLMEGNAFYGHMRGNASGLYGGIAVIGALTLGWPALRAGDVPAPWRGAARVGLVALAAIGILLAILSQARSVFLATVVLLAAVVLIHLRRARAGRSGRVQRRLLHRRAALAATIVLSLAAVAGAVRVIGGPVGGNLGAVLHADAGRLESDSVGYRLALVGIAVENIARYPLLGTGFGTTESAIEAADYAVLHKDHEHYHNLYLQVAGMSGLIGLGFLLAVIGLFVRYAAAGLHSTDSSSRRLARFSLYAGLFFAVASLFQSRYDDPRGLALIALLTGCALVCRHSRSAERTTA